MPFSRKKVQKKKKIGTIKSFQKDCIQFKRNIATSKEYLSLHAIT